MEELTIRQAHEYSKARGKGLSISFLVRSAAIGRIKARKVELPIGTHYWMIDKAALDAYLAIEHKPGPKKGSQRTPKGSEGEEDTQTKDAA
ncbi:MAG TPA: hypothetical protein VKT82_01665 [Ktedonobacterales bacterium]|nr:hypothetical protein [Ktedonobacterales bacterium]